MHSEKLFFNILTFSHGIEGGFVLGHLVGPFHILKGFIDLSDSLHLGNTDFFTLPLGNRDFFF